MRLRTIALLGVGALLPIGVVMASCTDDGPGDTARFCSEVQEHLPALTANPESLEDVDAFVVLYREIGDVAPLAIEGHWEALARNYATASTVDPQDPESLEAARAQAFATEESAVAVRDFLITRCNVDMGPIATIVPHGSAAPAGTIPPTTPAG